MTPAEVMGMSASLLNDTAQTVYTTTAQLPYFNMALRGLQEWFELNNVPVTNITSAKLDVAAGVSRIAFTTTTPVLPAGLIEIQQMWESPDGQNQWTPMAQYEYLPHNLEMPSQAINQFLLWAWVEQEIKLIAANVALDLKLDYIKSIFATSTTGDTTVDIPVLNSWSYLGFKTAALCARYIGENPTRADQLEAEAVNALDRTVGISTKGRQGIFTRRRPFMASYRRRGY